MGEKDESPVDVITEKEDLRAVLSWQQQRFQHLQSLAQGVLSLIIAVLAVLVSTYVAFSHQLPPLAIDPDSFDSVVTEVYFGEFAVAVILLMNAILLVFLMTSLALFLIFSFTDLFNIITHRGLDNGIIHDKGFIFIDGEYLGKMDADLFDYRSNSVSDAIESNYDLLNSIYSDFVEATLRVGAFLLFIVVIVSVYNRLFSLEVYYLVGYNITMIFFAPAFKKIDEMVRSKLAIGKDQPQNQKTLLQELFSEEEGRWKYIDERLPERAIFQLIGLVSLISVTTVILSILYQAVIV